MIEPVQKDEAFLQDVRGAEPGKGFALWWLGQSGFLIKSASGYLLFDPYLSNSLTAKYAHTDKPHTRMTARVVDPRRLDMINVATSSHNHTDHLDAETLFPLWEASPRMELVIPEANRDFVKQRLGSGIREPIGLRDGESREVGGFCFHGIAAAHEEVSRDELGRPHYLGYIVEFDGHTIYHSGDTIWHDELLSQLAEFSIDVALLPINGRLPTRRVSGNLWGQEAACLAREMRARWAVPCHFEMFTFNTESPSAFTAKCEKIGQPCHVMRAGERFDVRG